MPTIPAWKAEMTRCAYAIEYDCVDPTELTPLWSAKDLRPLYGAGPVQLAPSGYEEAAARGTLWRGVSAALKMKG